MQTKHAQISTLNRGKHNGGTFFWNPWGYYRANRTGFICRSIMVGKSRALLYTSGKRWTFKLIVLLLLWELLHSWFFMKLFGYL